MTFSVGDSGHVAEHNALTAQVDLLTAQVDLLTAQAFDVTRFGAVGDGSTNDTAAIQAAIDAAEANLGGVVFFPSGHYRTTPLTVAVQGVYLVGAGRGTTSGGSLVGGTIIERASSSTTGDLITLASGSSGIRHLNIRGGGVGGACVKTAGARIHIHDCQIGVGGTSCLELDYDGASTTLVSDCIIKDGANYGITLTDGTDNKFVNVQVFTCTGRGVSIEASGGGASFWTGCHIAGTVSTSDSNGDGFYINAQNTQLVNCESENNGRHGINLASNAARWTGVVGGAVWENSKAGVYVDGADKVRIVGVQIRDNGEDSDAGNPGIHLVTGSEIVVNANTCFDTRVTKKQTYGVLVAAAITNAVVTSNIARATDHLTGGIADNGVGSVVANNITT